MSTRSLFRFVSWTVKPDREPDAAPVTHLYRCTSEDEAGNVCGAESERTEDGASAEDWALRHAAENPDHRSYAYAPELPYVATTPELFGGHPEPKGAA
ncbi:hypothetical protein FSY75_34755 [Streptomyces sp. TR1341]|uniref:DUF7848 domain-containing protein n=1 Tax=Streptomyces TaxID=1883 RepID=UPI00138ACC4D|nr:hypothetical protein [Streptomyces sp. TR1341]